MITYHLGEAEVRSYAQDLAGRLAASALPDIWVPLGVSGSKFAQEVVEQLEEARREQFRLVRANWNRDTQEVQLQDEVNREALASGRVFVIDSAVHSGASMLAVCEHLAHLGAGDIVSYSLILKKGSCFVPTFFGLLIDDEDRAYFQLPVIPNNRLMKKKEPVGYLRPIRESDATLPTMPVGVKSVETSFGELLYETKARGMQVYLYIVRNDVCGFVCLSIRGRQAFINSVAAHKGHRGKGIGPALVRWTETLARSSQCERIDLWAIGDRIEFYKEMGYSIVEDETFAYDGEAKYKRMQRKILYNTKEHTMKDF